MSIFKFIIYISLICVFFVLETYPLEENSKGIIYVKRQGIVFKFNIDVKDFYGNKYKNIEDCLYEIQHVQTRFYQGEMNFFKKQKIYGDFLFEFKNQFENEDIYSYSIEQYSRCFEDINYNGRISKNIQGETIDLKTNKSITVFQVLGFDEKESKANFKNKMHQIENYMWSYFEKNAPKDSCSDPMKIPNRKAKFYSDYAEEYSHAPQDEKFFFANFRDYESCFYKPDDDHTNFFIFTKNKEFVFIPSFSVTKLENTKPISCRSLNWYSLFYYLPIRFEDLKKIWSEDENKNLLKKYLK
jgi:hypothetical protein